MGIRKGPFGIGPVKQTCRMRRRVPREALDKVTFRNWNVQRSWGRKSWACWKSGKGHMVGVLRARWSVEEMKAGRWVGLADHSVQANES